MTFRTKKEARDAEDGYIYKYLYDVTDSIESNNKEHSAHSAHTADVDTSRVQKRDDAVNWVGLIFWWKQVFVIEN